MVLQVWVLFISYLDPVQIAELLVIAIQYLPKDLYFPTNDSVIQSLYGQTGIPSTRDLILISRNVDRIKKEMFNIPTVSVCYRAIYSVRVGMDTENEKQYVTKRSGLLLSRGRSLVMRMLREGTTDYAQKRMRSVFITNIFTQEDGDVFKEEVFSLLVFSFSDCVFSSYCCW